MQNEKHAALIRIPLSDDELGTPEDDVLVERLEVALRTALNREPSAGTWDGHEFGGGWAVIFCYSNDAEALMNRTVEAILPFELPLAATIAFETHALDGSGTMTVMSVGCLDGAGA